MTIECYIRIHVGEIRWSVTSAGSAELQITGFFYGVGDESHFLSVHWIWSESVDGLMIRTALEYIQDNFMMLLKCSDSPRHDVIS